MSIADRLRQTIAIERMTLGDDNEIGQPAASWSVLATVKGGLQPRQATEVEQAEEAGGVVEHATLFLLPTDIRTSDRIRSDADPLPWFVNGKPIDPAGKGHHLECDVVRRTAAPDIGTA